MECTNSTFLFKKPVYLQPKFFLLVGLFLVSFSFVQAQNNALHFDGVNDYVKAPATTSYDFTTGTIECWIRPDGFNGNSTIIATRTASATRFSFHMSASQIGLWNGSSWMALSYTFTPGQWYHLAFVCTPSATTIFVNGSSIGNTGNLIGTATGLPLQIGMSFPTATGEQFIGVIDEVRLWNVARTQAQIQANMNSTLTGTETNLVGLFAFNQGIANGNNTGLTIATDGTANKNNGTLYNFALNGNTSNWVGSASGTTQIQTLSSSPTITFTNNSGFSDNIAQDGEGGSVIISDMNIQAMPIDNSGAKLTGSPLQYHDGTEPSWAGYPPIITYGDWDLPYYGWSIKSDNGAEYSLVSLDFMDWGEWYGDFFVAEAFRNGSSLGSVSFRGNTDFPPVQLSNPGILTDIFKNVDEVRLYRQGGIDAWTGLNNIKVSTAATALPVRFTASTVQPKNGIVELNWTTASEQNSRHFEVERSANGTVYTKIGTIAAAGNSHLTNHYQFTDAAPLQGHSYYRLKQVDIDGKSMYSTIEKVAIVGEGFAYTTVQNPVSNILKLAIQLHQPQKLKLEVRDARGVLLLQQQQQFSAGNTTYTLPVANLASGTYFVTIITDSGNNTKTFIKQ